MKSGALHELLLLAVAREQEEELRLEGGAGAAVVEGAQERVGRPVLERLLRLEPLGQPVDHGRLADADRSLDRHVVERHQARAPASRRTAEASGQSREQLARALAEHRVHELGPDLDQRLEHEAPLGEPRVRQHRVGRAASRLAEEEDVDVDRARTVRLAAHAPELVLDRETRLKQRLGGERGLAVGDRVHEPALGRTADGLGQVERARKHPAIAQHLEPRERALDRGFAVAEVRAETQHHARLHTSLSMPLVPAGDRGIIRR